VKKERVTGRDALFFCEAEMTKNLRTEDVDTLLQFLVTSGLGGRTAVEVQSVCCTLLGLVDRIVEVAIEDVKVAAVKAGCDALEEQQERLFDRLRRQLEWSQ
jgi:hypothetical protein